MIQLDPTKRLGAAEYAEQWRDKAFPEYFYTFLHQYIADLNQTSIQDSMSSFHTGVLIASGFYNYKSRRKDR